MIAPDCISVFFENLFFLTWHHKSQNDCLLNGDASLQNRSLLCITTWSGWYLHLFQAIPNTTLSHPAASIQIFKAETQPLLQSHWEAENQAVTPMDLAACCNPDIYRHLQKRILFLFYSCFSFKDIVVSYFSAGDNFAMWPPGVLKVLKENKREKKTKTEGVWDRWQKSSIKRVEQSWCEYCISAFTTITGLFTVSLPAEGKNGREETLLWDDENITRPAGDVRYGHTRASYSSLTPLLSRLRCLCG